MPTEDVVGFRRRNSAMRISLLMFVACGLLLVSRVTLAAEPSIPQFVKTHCVSCHGPDLQESGLRLDQLPTDFSVSKTFELGVKIHDRLHAGEMPPKGSPQPTPAERRELVESLKAKLTAADLSRRAGKGRAPVRRLNRTEYANTLRDVLDLPDLSVRDMLPEDGRVNGYDKSGDGLELSHVQIAKYLEVADLAMDAATAVQIEPPEPIHIREYPTQRNGYKIQLGSGDCVLLKDFKVDESILKMPREKKSPLEWKQEMKDAQKALDAFRGSVGIFRQGGIEFNPYFHEYTTEYAGLYRVRISLWSFTWDKGEILPATQLHTVQLRAGPKGKERFLGYFDVNSLQPTVIEKTVWLYPGDQIGFNGTTLLPLALTGPGGRAEWTGQGMAVDWLEVDGPLYLAWPPESHRRLFGDVPLVELKSNSLLRAPDHSLSAALGQLRGKARAKLKKAVPWAVTSSQPKEDAARLLSSFLPRLFRRPVKTDEINRYVALVEQMLAENLTFEDALRWAYKSALCSPEFLFFAEPPGKLNDWALASRLSYFLWNSLPDERLLALAATGELHQPDVLRQQVNRMLDDPKGERFVENFLDQWLDLQEIDATTPDRKLYPEFNVYLRDSMLEETRAFFREMLRRDLSAECIVDSDFAMLNAKMAEHYNIPNVSGSKFRPVKLPAEAHRGGMLTQASILKVTANGTTTTPVKRGAWVMREILGKPPAPPPPNVPAVEPDINGVTTIREQLAKHRDQQVCAACHVKMDPPGFALENFDVIGSWRTRYRSLGEGEPTKSATGRNVPYLLGPAVEPSGQLADGREFANIDDLRRILLSDADQIARNLIEQLVTYSTGAEISFADRQAVEKILATVRSQRYGVRTMIHEIVQSPLFLEK